MTTITFLSDYGYEDDFVGVCHAVIARHRARRPRHRPRPRPAPPRGAPGRARAAQRPALHAARACTWPWSTPRSAPSAAPSRCARPRTTACSSAPTTACSRSPTERFGGVVEAVEIGALEVAPGARLGTRSTGATSSPRSPPGWPRAWPLAEAGDPLDPAELVGIELPRPRHERGRQARSPTCSASTASATSPSTSSHEDLTESGLRLGHPVLIEAGAGRRRRAHYAVTFADVAPGELLVYEDAWRTLAVAVNRGNAARELGLRPDAELRLRAEP